MNMPRPTALKITAANIALAFTAGSCRRHFVSSSVGS